MPSRAVNNCWLRFADFASVSPLAHYLPMALLAHARLGRLSLFIFPYYAPEAPFYLDRSTTLRLANATHFRGVQRPTTKSYVYNLPYLI